MEDSFAGARTVFVPCRLPRRRRSWLVARPCLATASLLPTLLTVRPSYTRVHQAVNLPCSNQSSQ